MYQQLSSSHHLNLFKGLSCNHQSSLLCTSKGCQKTHQSCFRSPIEHTRFWLPQTCLANTMGVDTEQAVRGSSLKTRKFQFKYVTLSTSHYHILSPLHPERLQQIQTGSMKRTPYGEMPQQWLSVARWTADASVPSHCECILATCFTLGG